MSTELKLYNACVIMLYITIAAVAIATAYIFLSQKRPTEVFYAITVENTVYDYPYWNITLLAEEPIPTQTHAVQIFYKDYKIVDSPIKNLTLREGDRLILSAVFDSYVAPRENFTLYLWFKGNIYERFLLSLPEENSNNPQEELGARLPLTLCCSLGKRQ